MRYSRSASLLLASAALAAAGFASPRREPEPGSIGAVKEGTPEYDRLSPMDKEIHRQGRALNDPASMAEAFVKEVAPSQKEEAWKKANRKAGQGQRWPSEWNRERQEAQSSLNLHNSHAGIKKQVKSLLQALAMEIRHRDIGLVKRQAIRNARWFPAEELKLLYQDQPPHLAKRQLPQTLPKNYLEIALGITLTQLKKESVDLVAFHNPPKYYLIVPDARGNPMLTPVYPEHAELRDDKQTHIKV